MRSQCAWATRFGLSNGIDEILPAVRPLHPTLARVAEPSGNRPGRGRLLISLLAGALTGRIRRYEIVDRSMEPTLRHGDWTIGIARPRSIHPGQIVVVELPGRPGFDIVKRIDARDGDTIRLIGDNPDAGSVDSTRFGPLPAGAVAALLVLRYRPRPVRFLQ